VFAILDELKMTADEAYFIGDTYVDISTGKNAGIESIGVLWGFRSKEELEENNADMIVSSTDEILKFVKER